MSQFQISVLASEKFFIVLIIKKRFVLMIVYFNGQFMDKDEVRISPDDRGFIFGDGIYEVITSYNGKLFKKEGHFNRLLWNLKEVRINLSQKINLEEIALQLLETNNLLNIRAKIYIQITRGVAPRTFSFPSPETRPTVFVQVSEAHPQIKKWENGVKIILRPDQRRKRRDIKSISLLPSILDAQQAIDENAEEVIFVVDGFITEGSHTTFCAVFNNEIWTYPTDELILPGITRIVVKELCKKINIPFIERNFTPEDLKKADELMLLGSTTEIMPVIQVENNLVKNGKPGPVTKKLQTAYRKMISEL